MIMDIRNTEMTKEQDSIELRNAKKDHSSNKNDNEEVNRVIHECKNPGGINEQRDINANQVDCNQIQTPRVDKRQFYSLNTTSFPQYSFQIPSRQLVNYCHESQQDNSKLNPLKIHPRHSPTPPSTTGRFTPVPYPYFPPTSYHHKLITAMAPFDDTSIYIVDENNNNQNSSELSCSRSCESPFIIYRNISQDDHEENEIEMRRSYFHPSSSVSHNMQQDGGRGNTSYNNNGNSNTNNNDSTAEEQASSASTPQRSNQSSINRSRYDEKRGEEFIRDHELSQQQEERKPAASRPDLEDDRREANRRSYLSRNYYYPHDYPYPRGPPGAENLSYPVTPSSSGRAPREGYAGLYNEQQYWSGYHPNPFALPPYQYYEEQPPYSYPSHPDAKFSYPYPDWREEPTGPVLPPQYSYPSGGPPNRHYFPPSDYQYKAQVGYDQQEENIRISSATSSTNSTDIPAPPILLKNPIPKVTPLTSAPIRRRSQQALSPHGDNSFKNNENKAEVSISKSPVTTKTGNNRSTFPTTPTTTSNQTSNNKTKYVTLQENDIVVGRGAPTQYHIGNEYFRELVADYHTSYFCAKRSDKPIIAMKVLDILKSRNARFVRRQKGAGGANIAAAAAAGSAPTTPGGATWVVVSEKLAYEKICAALRDGSTEVQRRVMSSSHKIREAIVHERKQQQHAQQQYYYSETSSFEEKENGHN